MKQSTKASLYLMLITAIWGATFPLIRNAVIHVDPNLFVAVRFSLAALIMLSLVCTTLKKTHRTLLIGSFIFGSLNSIAYLSQTIGLQTIHPARSAFITGVNVILVPFIAPLFKLGKPETLDFICSILCLVGLYILTGSDLEQISRGDLWTLLCAITFAVEIVYLQHLTNKIHDYKLLTFYQLLFTTPLAIIFSINSNYKMLIYPSVIVGILFCAIFATTLAYFLQTKYQKFTTAPKAALIFSLEPVFAALFSILLNEEAITPHMIVGGLIILLSLGLPGILQLRKTSAKQ